MSMPATTAPQSTCWTLESKLGITVRVSLSSTLNPDECTNEPEPDAFGHHFILTGAATSASHPRFELGHDHLSAIARTMLEQIKSLRHGWLDIADLSTSSHTKLEQAALTLRLVPSTTSEHTSYCQQTLVRLDWSDSRSNPPWPLSLLLQQTPLSTHLRDLIHRAASRTIVETLLASSASASLFHRWWRQRRVQVDPPIASIALSLSALAHNAADPAKLAPVHNRLETTHASPSTARLQALLTQLDHAVFPADESPSAYKCMPHQRRANPTPELDIADLPQSDAEVDWLPVETQQSTLAPHPLAADQHTDLGLDIVVLPDEPDILEF
ncbi:hypothetical protein PaG_04451 [Moesziomyces aphidis]|uniref:Uncharacterized protein n=1 Tax=Moesziomyces aphidis TaxID=84754 RepID=W3VIT4_MOEAP|nr:hypothetical protein PaG_04451 [Moesziomyces aphidis]